jgi:hypothetical protein
MWGRRFGGNQRLSVLALVALVGGCDAETHNEAMAGCPIGSGLELSGSLDGQPFCQVYGGGIVGDQPGLMTGFFDPRGALFLLARDPTDDPWSATPVEAEGVLRLPPAEPYPGRHLCAGTGSSYQQGPLEVRLRELSDLGSCPGQPVSGTIDVSNPLTGTVDGLTFDWSGQDFQGSFSAAQMIYVYGQGGVLLVDFEGATIVGGLLLIPVEGQSSRRAYCIGGGEALDGDVHPVVATITDLSRLPDCEVSQMDGVIDLRWR